MEPEPKSSDLEWEQDLAQIHNLHFDAATGIWYN